MKAVFLTEAGALETRHLPDIEITKDGVLVEMKASAICRTDLKMLEQGQRDLILPRVLGHEGVGQVVESRNSGFNKGDWVALYPGLFCGDCIPCRAGNTARCEKLKIFGFSEDGFFRSQVLFQEAELNSLIPLPQKDYHQSIALIEPLACCLNALKNMPNRKGTALLVGAGAVGSIFAALLVSQKWEHVLVVDKDMDRIQKELPKEVVTIHASTETLATTLSAQGWQHQIDFVVSCCPEGLYWPFWDVMRPGGTVSFFSGGIHGRTMLTIDMNAVHYLELSLVGSYGCNKIDFITSSAMLAGDEIDLSFFELNEVRIEDVQNAMERLKKKLLKKVVITKF